MRRALIRKGRRWLYVIHRWIGIATCLLFGMWFGSGVVMMYVAFPQLTERERLAALPAIAWDRVLVAPDRAMAIAGVASYPRDLRLVMLNDTPVYRLLDWNGIFVLTWMFSGWLSLNPSEYFAARGPTPDMAIRYAGHDTPQIAATLPSMLPPGAVEARLSGSAAVGS